jgi:hypothetical protein|nr:hypothetical protein [uncultured Dongia sp.]
MEISSENICAIKHAVNAMLPSDAGGNKSLRQKQLRKFVKRYAEALADAFQCTEEAKKIAKKYGGRTMFGYEAK